MGHKLKLTAIPHESTSATAHFTPIKQKRETVSFPFKKATTGFEPVNRAFAELRLTTWPRRHLYSIIAIPPYYDKGCSWCKKLLSFDLNQRFLWTSGKQGIQQIICDLLSPSINTYFISHSYSPNAPIETHLSSHFRKLPYSAIARS